MSSDIRELPVIFVRAIGVGGALEAIGSIFRFAEGYRAGYMVEPTAVSGDGDTVMGVERLWSVCDDEVYCGCGAAESRARLLITYGRGR